MAVVKAHFDRRGKVGNAKAKDNVRYIQHRPDKDKKAVMRQLFDDAISRYWDTSAYTAVMADERQQRRSA